MTVYTRIKNAALRRTWTGSFRRKPCSHLDQMSDPAASAEVCVECVAQGDTWPALRMCMTCGYVGCCDSSKNKHAIAHFRGTQHPIAKSIEPAEEWAWCYIDQLWFERLVLLP